jgi:hypothetical protein
MQFLLAPEHANFNQRVNRNQHHGLAVTGHHRPNLDGFPPVRIHDDPSNL